MFPLKDNIPTDRFPIVTVALIVINVVVSSSCSTAASIFSGSTTPRSSSTARSPTRSRTRASSARSRAERDRSPCEGPAGRVRQRRRSQPADAPHRLHVDVHARRDPAHRRQHAVPVDLRQQRRGLHGAACASSPSTCSAGWRRWLGQVLIDPELHRADVGASGAIAAVLGGYMLLYPRARVADVVFVIFFFTLSSCRRWCCSASGSSSRSCFGADRSPTRRAAGGGVA